MILSIDDFAKRCNMPRRALMVYVKRQSVFVDGETVDTNHEKNVAFYNNREAKGLLQKKSDNPEPAKIAKRSTPDKQNDAPQTAAVYSEPLAWDGKGTMPLGVAERMIKHESALKTKADKELTLLKIEKLNGMLIPTDLVKALFLNFSKATGKAIQEQMSNFLTIIVAKYRIPDKEAKEHMSKMLDFLNSANDKANANTKKDLTKIIEAYSLSKGRGEK